MNFASFPLLFLNKLEIGIPIPSPRRGLYVAYTVRACMHHVKDQHPAQGVSRLVFRTIWDNSD